MHSGDWYQADDLTAPVYFWQMDSNGAPALIRGQVLVMIDLRSTYILNVALIPERNYNARAIRTQITRTCDEHGMPRKGFYFEGGIWKKSRILKGVEGDALSWAETELGLREFGLQFIHARLPRAKPVERVIGAIQNLMEGLPGYVGRNEQIEKFEGVQKLILAASRGKEDPRQHFMSADGWMDKLDGICREYNSDPQDGKLDGLSPEDAFHQFNDLSNPQTRLDASVRYLLAHHKRPVKVHASGIKLQFGKQTYRYMSNETGPLVGETVLAWFDPGEPDSIVITDMKRKNPITIERIVSVPAVSLDDAGNDLLSKAMETIADHQRHAIVRYRSLKSKYSRPFRANVVDRQTVEFGQEIARQKKQIAIADRQESSRARWIERKAGEADVPLSIIPGRDSETESALEELNRLRAKHRSGEILDGAAANHEEAE
ncbi:MAG TPA: hypothetical protein PKW32_02015 [Verrucomicrobiota bacterium]|nr:hypothetical protein [Verrucomicrobiota bacterium]